jgi:hypothetical protein
MSGTSAAGGYITDALPGPPSADAVEAALQTMVAQLSGLPGSLVRPRWQKLPPVQPDAETTWIAVGVVAVEADDYPTIRHVSDESLDGKLPPGYDILTRHQTITVTATFYGPDAENTAGRVRDALYLPSNFAPVGSPCGLKLREVHDLARTPEMINQQWVNRIDLRIEYRQQIERRYAIFDLVGADVVLTDGHLTDTVTVRPAP